MATSDEQLRRKLVIVGDGAAGKTSLLNVFAVGHFPENYVSYHFMARRCSAVADK
jgi:GTPase SAR1 family protein